MQLKSKGFNAYTKYIILKHGLKEKNVSKTCELFGISRTSFYNWLRAYEKYGIEGLEEKERKKPNMPNKVSKEVEAEILAYVAKHPKDGPRRIHYELKAEGIEVGETGIYNVLRKNNLNKMNQRMEYAKNKSKSNRLKQKENSNLQAILNFPQKYPGYLVLQKIDYIGNFDGIGRIYQYCFFDVASKWGEVKIYNRKQDIDIWLYFEQKLIYLLETFNLTIDNIITERKREFLPYVVKSNKFNEIIGAYNINHIFAYSEDHYIFKEIIEFNEFLMEEFYKKIPLNKKLDTFRKVEVELYDFIRKYNFLSKIPFGPNAGKTPAEAVLNRAIENGTDLDTLPLWILALINYSNGVGKIE